MSGIKVIGIGSPFGHDTLGWQVIDHLKRQYIPSSRSSRHIDLIEADRPGISLIQMLQGAQLVILIDAIQDERKHGEIIRLDKSQLIHQQNRLSSHVLDVSSAIALAEKLRLLPEKLVILGLGINPEHAVPLNETAIHKLTDAVICELEAYFSQILTA